MPLDGVRDRHSWLEDDPFVVDRALVLQVDGDLLVRATVQLVGVNLKSSIVAETRPRPAGTGIQRTKEKTQDVDESPGHAATRNPIRQRNSAPSCPSCCSPSEPVPTDRVGRKRVIWPGQRRAGVGVAL